MITGTKGDAETLRDEPEVLATMGIAPLSEEKP